jgi:hypothetical protein
MAAGVTGYYCQQVTDDRADSRKIKDRLGRVFAAGPGIMIKVREERLYFEFRPQFEFKAKNRFQGGSYWFNWRWDL